MILAKKIVKLRKQIGWSQEELAEKMNVSRQAVMRILPIAYVLNSNY